MSWLRSQEEQARPAKPCEESPCELEERLQLAVRWVNHNYDVRGLCRGLPDRLHTLANVTRGDRLPK